MSAAFSLPTHTNVSTPLSLVPALPENKYCPLCKSRLPLDAFQPDRRSRKDGHRWYCKAHFIERAVYGSHTAYANARRYADALEEIALEKLLGLLTDTWQQINKTAEAERLLLARKLTPQDWFLAFRAKITSAVDRLREQAKALTWTLKEALLGVRNDLSSLWDELRRLKNRVSRKYGAQPLTFWERYCRAMGGLTS